jgi:hypothetical protein
MSKIFIKKRFSYLFALLGLTVFLSFSFNDFLHGFCPIYISPIQKITYASISPKKLARVFVSYYRFGDRNYNVWLQKKMTCSVQLIYKSPDLDYPIETERVKWLSNENSFEFLSKNSGDDSKTNPSERLLWCYNIKSERLDRQCK